VEEGYEEVCARIGVEPRPEGWALWNTWSDGELKVTMVVTSVETTGGLLENWSRGRAVDSGLSAAVADRRNPPWLDRTHDVLAPRCPQHGL
jgi:hypothetical protein